MKYEYDYEDASVMYEQYGPEPPLRVNAKYIPATNKLVLGNPFYEALPVLKPYNRADYIVRFPFEPTKAGEGSDMDRKDEVYGIDDVRVPYKFQESVLDNFRATLIRAARDHEKMAYKDPSVIVMNDREQEQSLSFMPPNDGDVGNGFCFVGFPGSTKTSTICNILEKYPKVIVHKWKNGGVSTQVPIVRVVCQPNDNLATLFENIGERLDKLLGNSMEHHCTKLVHRENSLTGKASAVTNLLVAYNVLVLVLDEVQELDFKKNKSTSFHALVTIVNRAKCALVSVGTQEALEKVYSEWYAGDRAGEYIDTSPYCMDRNHVKGFLQVLFSTQWFDEKVSLTNDIVDAFVDCTGGSMRKMKALYIAATRDYISNRLTRQITVNGNYFRSIAISKWDRLAKIIQEKQSEYKRLNERLRLASSKKEQEEIQKAIDQNAAKSALIVASLEEGTGPERLKLKAKEYFAIKDKVVNDSDLEDVCCKVYDKYFANKDTTYMVKKVVKSFDGKNQATKVKDFFPADKTQKEMILEGN